STPMRFGQSFNRPSKKTLRIERAKKGPRMFSASEIRMMLAAASTQLKAMVLLGINAAFGNADCGRLPFGALDLNGCWVTYSREKTGVARRAKLWPEAVEAIREAITQRPKPKEDGLEDRVFVTARGGSWFKQTDNPLAKETSKLLRRL